MAFEKAAYWMAVGVLSLFVSNHFAVRHENDVRGLAGQSLAAVEQVAGDATRFLATVETTLGGTRFAGTHTRLACAQTRLASMQSVIAQNEASMASVQAEHSRMAAMQRLSSLGICPRQHVRTAIHQPSYDGTI
jgi:hypothetical protein